MKIVFASWNPKKTEEIQRMMKEYRRDFEIISLKDLPEAQGVPQAEENGDTFLDNAIIKAEYWSKRLKMPVLAEDSGLKIEALGGYPGVRTKRCMEEINPDADINIDNPSELYPALLEAMRKTGNTDKTAYWVTAMAFADGDNTYIAVSSITGEMCECTGKKEFGFDQYFMPHDIGMSLAELTPYQKDNIGPRFRVLVRVLDQID